MTQPSHRESANVVDMAGVAPPGCRVMYLACRADRDEANGFDLLCDPLTGLIAYPSFERYLRQRLAGLASHGLHLAIGDVDDLKIHVTARRTSDLDAFGHLAGNACMREVGAITRRWAGGTLSHWPFAICATFGGDEVIVAAAGQPYGAFRGCISELADQLRTHAPRPCSFATTTLCSSPGLDLDGFPAYRALVVKVDEALFDHKARLRSRGIAPNGEVTDAGAVELPCEPLPTSGRASSAP